MDASTGDVGGTERLDLEERAIGQAMLFATLRKVAYALSTAFCGLLIGGATGWLIGLQARGEETPFYGLFLGGLVGVAAASLMFWLLARSRGDHSR